MSQDVNGFIEKVIELAEKYGYKVSYEPLGKGKSVATFWELTIDNAEVVVETGNGRCIVTDKEENVKEFKRPQSEECRIGEYRTEEWEQEGLDHIETLLKMRISQRL